MHARNKSTIMNHSLGNNLSTIRDLSVLECIHVGQTINYTINVCNNVMHDHLANGHKITT